MKKTTEESLQVIKDLSLEVTRLEDKLESIVCLISNVNGEEYNGAFKDIMRIINYNDYNEVAKICDTVYKKEEPTNDIRVRRVISNLVSEDERK